MLEKAGELVDRASNRLIWALAARRRAVDTDVPLVSFTFDDVPDTALLNAAPILERYGAAGTFYIAGGLAGRVEPGRGLISRRGCKELAARGHEIGCHTFSHRRLRDYGPALGADLDRNAAFLSESGVGAAPANFAFPYNAAWPSARGELGRRFCTCRGAGEAINRGAADPLMLKAVEIRQPEAHARRLTAWIDELAASPGWLIFFTHDVAPVPTPYGCTPETFEILVGHAVAKGCRVVSVREAASRLGWGTP